MSAGYVESGLSDRVEFVLRDNASRAAGARGRHAEPLTVKERYIHYARQCGARSIFRDLTPAQRRRVEKKANKARG